MKKKPNNKPLELVGAKIPPDIKELIENRAVEEERSISQIISRLLASHPEVKRARRTNKAIA